MLIINNNTVENLILNFASVVNFQYLHSPDHNIDKIILFNQMNAYVKKIEPMIILKMLFTFKF